MVQKFITEYDASVKEQPPISRVFLKLPVNLRDVCSFALVRKSAHVIYGLTERDFGVDFVFWL